MNATLKTVNGYTLGEAGVIPDWLGFQMQGGVP